MQVELEASIKERIIKTLDWMVTDMCWRHDEVRGNLEQGSQGGYSPELSEAIELLDELKNGSK